MQRVPTGDRSRHGDGVNAALRHLRVAARLQQRRRQPRRRAAARVEAVERAGLRVIDDGEQIAADAVRLRFDEAHHRIGRDRRVNRVAAPLQDLHSCLRRQWLTGGNDAVPGGDPRSPDDDTHAPHPTHSAVPLRSPPVTLRSRLREQESRRIGGGFPRSRRTPCSGDRFGGRREAAARGTATEITIRVSSGSVCDLDCRPSCTTTCQAGRPAEPR